MPYKEFTENFPWENEEYLFRTDTLEFIELQGHSKYNGSNTHKILKKIEYKKDREWKLYPSVIWVDQEGFGTYGLCTVFFTADGKGGIEVLLSPDGVPDGELSINAKEKGIFTATYG